MPLINLLLFIKNIDWRSHLLSHVGLLMLSVYHDRGVKAVRSKVWQPPDGVHTPARQRWSLMPLGASTGGLTAYTWSTDCGTPALPGCKRPWAFPEVCQHSNCVNNHLVPLQLLSLCNASQQTRTVSSVCTHQSKNGLKDTSVTDLDLPFLLMDCQTDVWSEWVLSRQQPGSRCPFYFHQWLGLAARVGLSGWIHNLYPWDPYTSCEYRRGWAYQAKAICQEVGTCI